MILYQKINDISKVWENDIWELGIGDCDWGLRPRIRNC
jgi:hypothetical protein